ncbi:enoyl-CoA hydratase [Geobacillus sp. 44B]|jgi:methylglutaconyl-CoA hydratase|uniref:enoyl-CoA hydratase n=1 Tax=Saccharococcus caldoxylosilyticus TaxID=81408 RepID=UPI0002ED609B|nr:enoyl-CoA hydratase [Parageobacillus caldoxylosilyticus]OQP02511.1 enoyl-CoA hydratase [Geobacillus sp. 44B]QNU37343.1 enoyl-CoA hydratase [Geobacillus sp. 44B]BDG35669.1 putative enoyl-CoA hydratase/isomerase YngF [Parageobacillus caldoxylosilyticus]BDG39448.1 putative enoyl-CoA hydratase/isomerase YngF [Parageobacillus caldoxylosilyticus]
MSSFVSYELQENGIAIVTLNRPEAANALSTSLLNELSELLGDLAFRKDIRVVIVTGAGEKVFCAGADLKERAGMNETEVRKTVALIRETINQVEQLPQPVIAVLNGSAFGGGLELALACDIRVAVDTAQLGLTETSLGIIPGAGGTQRLPRLIGKGKAKELIFTAKRITAQEAAQIGLVEYVVPRAQLMEKALEIAGQIAANAPIAVRQAKLAVNRGLDVDLATGLRLEQMAYEVTIPTKDRLEGLQAFKEKRKPVYKGE